jgi:uncharacterized membrane protein YhaH (DUF805 family)
MRSLSLIERPLGRAPFMLAAVAILTADALVKLAISGPPDSWTDVPLFLARSFLQEGGSLAAVTDLQLLGWTVGVFALWIALTVLALRRAKDAAVAGWVAALAMVPYARLGVVIYLALVPPQAPDVNEWTSASSGRASRTETWRTAAVAVLAGTGLCVLAVAIGALGFGSYQVAMFLSAPFIIGVAAGYLANRDSDRGLAGTTRIVGAATVLGSLALIGFALEGAICVLMAAPLTFLIAWLGGLVGLGIARSARRSAVNAFAGFLLLPLAFAADSFDPQRATFELESSVEIDAPAADVWSAVIHMDTIEESPPWLFRLGVAYPVRGETLGEGVGTTRHGVFSTGIAIERVTVWERDRQIAFVVLSEPPSMRELSPYRRIDTPHVKGYFTTAGGSFRLLPIGDGRTRLIERTTHSLSLGPTSYWLPLARWVVRQNHARVLTHIKGEAEHATGLPAQGVDAG